MKMDRRRKSGHQPLAALVSTALGRLTPVFAPLEGYEESDFQDFCRMHYQEVLMYVYDVLNSRDEVGDLHVVGEETGEFLHTCLNKQFYDAMRVVKKQAFAALRGEEDTPTLNQLFQYCDIMGFIGMYCGLVAHWENSSTQYTSHALLGRAEACLQDDDIDTRLVGVLQHGNLKIIQAAECFFSQLDKKDFQSVLQMEKPDPIGQYIQEKSGIDILR